MEIKEFYLYKNVNGSNQTLGIRKIDFQEPYNLTNVFTEKIARKDSETKPTEVSNQSSVGNFLYELYFMICNAFQLQKSLFIRFPGSNSW